MYFGMSRRGAEKRIERARRSHLSNDSVEYPEWYLVHWHFLPGGYLSKLSTAAYDRAIRRIYSAGQEARINDRIARMVYRNFPDGRLLELGCGPGRMLEALDEAGSQAEIVGVDLSPYQLERAEARNAMSLSPTKVVHASATALPWGEGFFDAAVAVHLIGHLPKDVANDVMAEAFRVVRPGGRLYLYEHRWHSIPPGPWRRIGSSTVRRALGRIMTFERSR